MHVICLASFLVCTDSLTQILLLFFRRAMQTGEALHIGDDDDDDEEEDDDEE